ncbi:hypothetical protein H5410_000395 [Solanum commersonii]|uniref:Uncharacterized protein n=1 Tax=Solanum commersonii TaxID=4109 RepID=A0A9J6AVX0_SOLCO|nr:hypothetical protein H5410_000395 [Solanum commersonii]
MDGRGRQLPNVRANKENIGPIPPAGSRIYLDLYQDRRGFDAILNSHELEPFILFRIMEVLHSAYKAGHIQIADYISFFITLLSRFQFIILNLEPGCFSAEKIDPIEKHEVKSNRGTFKSVVRAVCSSLSQIGDDVLVLQMLEKIVLDEISHKRPVDNIYGLIRLLITLDSKPTRLSEQTINRLSEVLPEYILDVVKNIAEEDDESTKFLIRQTRDYYLLPCFFLFDRSNMLLNQILEVMESFIRGNASSLLPHQKGALAKDHSSRILSVVSVLLLVLGDTKMQKLLLSCKTAIRNILESMHTLESSEDITMTIEERHKIRKKLWDAFGSLTNRMQYAIRNPIAFFRKCQVCFAARTQETSLPVVNISSAAKSQCKLCVVLDSIQPQLE